MAHHAHNHHNHPNSSHPSDALPTASPRRPLPLRILAITALLLPAILSIISLSLTLATLYNPAYALADLYTSNSTFSGVRLFASPFYHCSATSDGGTAVDDPASFRQSCARVAYLGRGGLGACYAAHGPGFPDTQFCQKSVAAAELYVAGAVLVGVAVLLGVAAAVLGWRAAVRGAGTGTVADAGPATSSGFGVVRRVAPLLAWLASLLALLASLCLAAGQALGISTYVSDQRPTAGNDVDAYQGRWYMGTPALAFSSVAWLSAALGAFVASTGFGVRGV
ncbi:hypothetical protein B0J18DRAFT_467158 [Chaetomium sp. MPI-SDFR-AT-0129]|nr:hypothetical protein B0J18DRAFT_467158 [Chaetomium sp. MPI-SDFR-AT-0129]